MGRFGIRAAIAILVLLGVGATAMVVSAQQESFMAACIDRAHEATLLDENEIISLCNGAPSEGPAICYATAQVMTTLDNVEGINLCRCAASEQPVTCYQALRARTNLFIDQAIALCSDITVRNLFPNCQPRVR